MNTIIFDMDGLMFDTESVFIKAWDYAGEKMGIGKAGYMTMKTLGMSIQMSKKFWVEEFGNKYDEDLLRKYTKEFFQKHYNENSLPIKQGLYELLDFLKQNNYKLGVASSSPRWEVEKHLRDAKVYRNFIINSNSTIRKDPFFYKDNLSSIDYDYIRDLIKRKAK